MLTDDGPRRINVSTATPWEPLVGYSRLVRIGPHVFVTGTTATLPDGGHVGDGDAFAQADQALRNIAAALARVGAELRHVARTRIFVTDIEHDWQAVGRAHAQHLGAVLPATSMVQVARLIEPWMKVEIEADAIAPSTAFDVIDDAARDDAGVIAAILTAAALPLPTSEDGPVSMLVARRDGIIVGCVGWESHGADALLRSLVVRTEARGRGLGSALVGALVARLHAARRRTVFLLTNDRAPFFAGHGFDTVPRDQAPAEIRAAREMAMDACRKAVLMARALPV